VTQLVNNYLDAIKYFTILWAYRSGSSIGGIDVQPDLLLLTYGRETD